MIKADDLDRAVSLRRTLNEMLSYRDHFEQCGDIRLSMPSYLVVKPDTEPESDVSEAYDKVRQSLVEYYNLLAAKLAASMIKMGVEP